MPERAVRRLAVYAAGIAACAFALGWLCGRSPPPASMPASQGPAMAVADGARETARPAVPARVLRAPAPIEARAGTGPRADASSIDPGRDFGAALACAQDPDPDTQLQCLRALDAHSLHRPEVLQAFVAALDRASTLEHKARIASLMTPVPLSDEDKKPLLDALDDLRTAPSPEIRAHGLPLVIQFDRGPGAEMALLQGLYDPEPAVVDAAIGAVGLSTVRSQAVKNALLVYANDAAADARRRFLALEALHDFALDADDYRLYRAARDAAPWAGEVGAGGRGR